MNRKRLLGIGLLTVLGLGAVTGGVYATQAHSFAHGPGALAAPLMIGGMGHGWRGKRHGGPGGHLCRAANGERLDGMITFVESFVDFTPEQDQAWQDLTAALRNSQVEVRGACDHLAQAEDPRRAPEALERAETMLSTGLDAVRQIRPAFTAFYETLDERQREALDGLLSRHRRHG